MNPEASLVLDFALIKFQTFYDISAFVLHLILKVSQFVSAFLDNFNIVSVSFHNLMYFHPFFKHSYVKEHRHFKVFKCLVLLTIFYLFVFSFLSGFKL